MTWPIAVPACETLRDGLGRSPSALGRPTTGLRTRKDSTYLASLYQIAFEIQTPSPGGWFPNQGPVEVVSSAVVVVVAGQVVVVVDGGGSMVVVVVGGGNVAGGMGFEVVVVGRVVGVVGLGGFVVVGEVGGGLVGLGAGVVVVVVGAGNTGVTENPGAEVVVANGAPRVVVVLASGPAFGTVVAVRSGTIALAPGAGGGLGSAAAADLPVHQSTPIVTAKASPPANATMTSPEMRRPTKTLLRHEKPACSGVDCERCSATLLARSSGSRRPLLYGSGNSADPSSPNRGPVEKLRRRGMRVNDVQIRTGAPVTRPLRTSLPGSSESGTVPGPPCAHRHRDGARVDLVWTSGSDDIGSAKTSHSIRVGR